MNGQPTSFFKNKKMNFLPTALGVKVKVYFFNDF